jgi:hypothetical protein
MLLEELSGTWLLENEKDEKGKQAVARSVEIVSPFLPKPWVARLEALLQKGWHVDKGWIRVYPRLECDTIVAKDLAFPHLNERFWQEEPPEPRKPSGES